MAICWSCGRMLTTQGVEHWVDGNAVRVHKTCADRLEDRETVRVPKQGYEIAEPARNPDDIRLNQEPDRPYKKRVRRNNVAFH